MSDETVDLRLLARQQRQIVADMATLKDDMGFTMAILMRIDGTLGGLVNELRAIHSHHGRLQNRVRTLEAAAEENA